MKTQKPTTIINSKMWCLIKKETTTFLELYIYEATLLLCVTEKHPQNGENVQNENRNDLNNLVILIQTSYKVLQHL